MSSAHGAPRQGLILRAKLAVTRARISTTERRDRLLADVGGALGQLGRRVVLRLHRSEIIPLPRPRTVGRFQFDVLDDLRLYTGLSTEHVNALVTRRADSFRAEWFLASPEHRVDDWFYLSSRTYLFGNATHDPTALLSILEKSCGTSGRALDFGGGTGNLALALAAVGWSIDYLERSALQKDFVAFRRDRYDLTDRLHIIDQWRMLERDTYDLICAMDVLEHVERLEELLTDVLLPAIKLGGALAESSPFTRSLSNPMHYEHSELEEVLARNGFVVEVDAPTCRVWRRTSP
jgi:SAM-dependent methyltransferase